MEKVKKPIVELNVVGPSDDDNEFLLGYVVD